ncbi:hypothetical protein LDENG_00144780 [Lucifuga dentata]|nr:hypothetical protein LDENG_00144780 [Lucifuga dentata]
MVVSNVTCMKIEYIRLKHANGQHGPLSCSSSNGHKVLMPLKLSSAQSSLQNSKCYIKEIFFYAPDVC